MPTSHLLMIRPVRFGYNAETAVNNAFQVNGEQAGVQQKAEEEFDLFVAKLQQQVVDVTVLSDTAAPYTPDSIFPNNWVSFHEDGTVFLYPMFAPNRRLERRADILESLQSTFTINRKIDLSDYENQNLFLEGTGSMVLDRDNTIAYACLSPRTDQKLLDDFCSKAGYQSVSFTATDEQGQLIYHTNVMMCVADEYVVICLDSIADEVEKLKLTNAIENSGKKIITISFEQMNHFAGNMLQVKNKDGQSFLVMSTQAFSSLSPAQIALLESFNPIIHSSLDTIETNGGGSARCMMAEIYLPVIKNP